MDMLLMMLTRSLFLLLLLLYRFYETRFDISVGHISGVLG